MARKTAKFTASEIGKLPNDKPVLYRILTPSGRPNYVGVAKRGRVQERLKEHLPGGCDPVPGAKVRVEQTASIGDAQKKERAVIARNRPKYNKR